ncbi:hypothetical protein [Streptomyces sp. NPDC005970]|uniref:hypothetical protein n=1 Tax=Streptomyces sp. NPDC005970 TaxID=3156723 RepID=UPI0033ED7509
MDISEFNDRALKIINSGIFNFGDNNNFNNNAVGEHAHVSVAAPSHDISTPAAGAVDKPTAGWDVGVVTILSEELRSVVNELKLERHKEPGGLYFYQGKHATPEATVRIVARVGTSAAVESTARRRHRSSMP